MEVKQPRYGRTRLREQIVTFPAVCKLRGKHNYSEKFNYINVQRDELLLNTKVTNTENSPLPLICYI